MPAKGTDPFSIGGVVTGQFFTNRADELARILSSLRQPGKKLLIYGPRRMGKSSTIAQALKKLKAEGGAALAVDLSTASNVVDMANRILEEAAKTLGRRWKDKWNDVAARMGVTVTLKGDPHTGILVPAIEIGLRSAPEETQRAELARALDTVNALAGDNGTTVGVVLDEFQEIRKFGGEDAEWHLRGTIQQHQHTSYILAGSKAHIIERMVNKNRAFYGLLDLMVFGPMPEAHLSAWIDDRMTNAGVKARSVGQRSLEVAGPSTRDTVQVALRCFYNCRATGEATPEDVDDAFDDVVAEQESVLQSDWSKLTSLQQNVLRAVAANSEGLTRGSSLARFGLSSSGAASNTASALVEEATLVRADSATGYAFDSPFLRRWVQETTLGDVGLGTTPSDTA